MSLSSANPDLFDELEGLLAAASANAEKAQIDMRLAKAVEERCRAKGRQEAWHTMAEVLQSRLAALQK